MWVITILTASNEDVERYENKQIKENEIRQVKTFYVGEVLNRGIKCTDWDEDIKFAKVYSDKKQAKIKRDYLRTLIGSDAAEIELKEKFSKS